MKKSLALIVTAGLLVLLAACGGGGASNSSGNELRGTYLDEETSTVALVFAGNDVAYTSLESTAAVQGSYETQGDSITFHFDEYTPMGDRPVPYELNESAFILDGTPYLRQ